MTEFTALEINPLGNHDEKYGTRYWGRVAESEMAVSFNLMQPLDVLPGAKLSFEERTIKETGPQSKNPGTEYLFLKKVKVQGGAPLPAPSAPKSDDGLSAKLDAMHGDIKLLLSFVRQGNKDQAAPSRQPDNVIEDIGDEPINLDDIPF